MLERISYNMLNSRQQENCNFHKAAALLSDYGFNCLRLFDYWQGAYFIAFHIDGQEFQKVQLKGRLTISRKYAGKSIYIAFWYDNEFYLYPHDDLMNKILDQNRINETISWERREEYTWPSLPKWILGMINAYKVVR